MHIERAIQQVNLEPTSVAKCEACGGWLSPGHGDSHYHLYTDPFGRESILCPEDAVWFVAHEGELWPGAVRRALEGVR